MLLLPIPLPSPSLGNAPKHTATQPTGWSEPSIFKSNPLSSLGEALAATANPLTIARTEGLEAMGTLFKKKGSKQWHMGVSVGGRQICRSAHTTNKCVAKRLLARWETEVFERRFHLPQSTPPYFEEFADEFLTKVAHPNTRKRYTSSVGKLKGKFTGVRLSDVSADGIEEYTEERVAEGVEPATINHDLRVLRRMMRL